MRKLFVWSAFLLALCLAVPVLGQAEFQFETFDDFMAYIERIAAADASAGQALVDELWTYLLETDQQPFVRQHMVAFMYRGAALSVEWVGDIVGWEADYALPGAPVGQTDLWLLTVELLPNARIEYKIIINGLDEWILDPANPHVVASGLSPNSELRMPLYAVTLVTSARDEVTPGTVTDLQVFDSANMGYEIGYWVYTPVGYETLDNLPVIYFLDGNDFIDPDLGGAVPALDNMIFDGWIDPVIAVFISARDPNNPNRETNNRRESEFLANDLYAAFVAEELVPFIDQQYDTNPAARVLVGVSYGGLCAAYIGVVYPELWAGIAPLSPSLWAAPQIEMLYLEAPLLPRRYFIGHGYPDWDLVVTQDGLDLLASKGVYVMYYTTVEGHSWATWRGMMDEMLAFFFGRSLSG
ncbi:MAG: hypothetical protein HXY40_04330 [Chloroflexi bacterium]|nr:hypothetical protein [Chloroflexota bacterium]